MRFGLSALIVSTLPGLALAQSGITGSYRAEGRNPDGSTYVGTVKIVETSGAVAMTWAVGNQTYTGTGALHDRVLTVDWGDSHPVVYVLMPDGDLHGTWSDGKALERLSR